MRSEPGRGLLSGLGRLAHGEEDRQEFLRADAAVVRAPLPPAHGGGLQQRGRVGEGAPELKPQRHAEGGSSVINSRAMAASKKAAQAKGAASPRTVSTAAFKHGTSAYGARFVKKGFGFDDQEDLEWALGWPHVRRLVDGHPDDADPLGFESMGAHLYDIDFPREQAARRVRYYLFCPSSLVEARQQTGTRGALERSRVGSSHGLRSSVRSGGSSRSRWATRARESGRERCRARVSASCRPWPER